MQLPENVTMKPFPYIQAKTQKHVKTLRLCFQNNSEGLKKILKTKDPQNTK